MDNKPRVPSGVEEEELRRIQRENQSLRAEKDRVQKERDDTETRFVNSQRKVAELEHRVRKQSWEIDDLKAEVRTLREGTLKFRSPPPRGPRAPTAADVIDISDDDEPGRDFERNKPIVKSSATAPSLPAPPENIRQHQTPQRKRQFMDSVSIPRAASKPQFQAPMGNPSMDDPQDTEAPSSTADPTVKRLRSVSPHVERSSASILVFGHEYCSPSLELTGFVQMDDGGAVWRPAKRLKKSNSKDEDVKGALLRDVADIYLANLPELQIQPPAQANFYVSRRFLLDKFRVLNQTFLGYFKPTNDSEHRRGAIFPQPGLNPFLPQAPGAAGLIFASRFEIIVDHELPWALFCKHKSAGGKIVWRYMGDYRNRHCGDLTAEQFKSQATAVKQQWGKLLIKSKMVEAYIAMRARIALRKAGVAFVRGDANEIREMGEVTRKGGRPLPVEAKDIIDALGRGEEVIGIIRMECISYNHELVAEMARRHEDWNVAPVPVQPVQRAGATKRRKRVSKTATRRICSDSSTSDYSPESESEDGASADLFAERARRQKRAHVDEPLRLSLGLGCDSSMSDLTELGDD